MLQAGGAQPLDVGYLPTVDAPVPPPGAEVGQNPVAGYTMQPVYTWGLSYIPYNFDAADPQVAIFRQLYFRQAFQLLVNQAAIVQGALHGYGKVTSRDPSATRRRRSTCRLPLERRPVPVQPR